MSDRGTNEAEQVRLGLAENDKSPWEWGIYIERNDGRVDRPDWVPLVYGGFDYEDAYRRWRQKCDAVTSVPDHFRNPRLVRRAVSPWEVQDHE